MTYTPEELAFLKKVGQLPAEAPVKSEPTTKKDED
jgi:hypothetical protein